MTSLAVHTTVALGLVSSLVLTLVGIFLAPQILRLMSTPEEIMDQSVEFFRMYFLGSAGFVMYNTLVSILQASGDSKHPVYYLIIASIINILLDFADDQRTACAASADDAKRTVSRRSAQNQISAANLENDHQIRAAVGIAKFDYRPVERHYSIIHKFLWQKCSGRHRILRQGRRLCVFAGNLLYDGLDDFCCPKFGSKRVSKNQSRSSIRHDLHAGFGGRVGDFAVRVLASCSGQFRRCKSTRLRSVLFPRGLYARDGCRHARSRESNDSDDNHDDLLVCRQNSDFVRCRDVLSNDSDDLLGLSVDVDAQFVGISAMLPRT